MHMQFVKGDVLELKADIICHQVNCQGVMEAGLAKQVADQYPIVKKKYKELCSQKSPSELLGTFQLVYVAENRAIANIFGQMFYGNDGKLYTNYEAFRSALKSLADQHPGKSVALPYGIGCGLAGGDWNTVYNIIREVFANDDRKVFICKKSKRSDDMTNIKTKTSETKGALETNNIPGAIDYEGGEVLIPKRYCKISIIQTNDANLEAVLKGVNPKTTYLGKVVIPGALFTLEIPILWNLDYNFPYALLAGESKGGFCSLKITDPNEEDNGVKAIFDLKTAAVMAFCRYTGLTSPKREKGGSCSSCKHRRYVEVDGEKREVCALDGTIIDSSWRRFSKYIESTDRGLIGKKEKDTLTYEHAVNSPNKESKNGRFKHKATIRKNYDEVVNCPYYAAWFLLADSNEWIKRESKELPWDGAKIIGSEVIVDVSDFLDPKEIHEEEVDKALEKIGINRNVLKLIATHNELGDSEDEIGEVLESVAKCKIKEETKSLLVKEILHMRK